MNPWIGKIAFLLGLIVFVAIRVPHDKWSKETKVAESRKSILERMLLVLMGIGCFLCPLVYLFTPIFSFADYPLSLTTFVIGIFCLCLALWLFHRSHVDLGRNWSATLELREGHQLVTGGIYKSIRHPMYTSIFLYAFAQVLLLPNWIAGPSCLVAFIFMFAFRFRSEERMMFEKFGHEYESYARRSKRLIPGVW